MFGFTDGTRLAWVRWEKIYHAGFETRDRVCVAVRDFDTLGPVANFKAASAC